MKPLSVFRKSVFRKSVCLALAVSLGGLAMASANEENIARARLDSELELPSAVAGYSVRTDDACDRPLTRAWISSQQPDGSSWQRWASRAGDYDCPVAGSCLLSGQLRSIPEQYILSSSIHAIALAANKEDLLVTGELLVGWQGGECSSGLTTVLGAFVWRLDPEGQLLADTYLGPTPGERPPARLPRCFELCGGDRLYLFAGRSLYSTGESTSSETIVVSGLQRPKRATDRKRNQLFVATFSTKLQRLSLTSLDHDVYNTDELLAEPGTTIELLPKSLRAVGRTAIYQHNLEDLEHEDQQQVVFDPSLATGQAVLVATFQQASPTASYDSLSLVVADRWSQGATVEVALWNWQKGSREVVASRFIDEKLSISIPAPAELHPGGNLISSSGLVDVYLTFDFSHGQSAVGATKGASSAQGGLDRIIIVSGPD